MGAKIFSGWATIYDAGASSIAGYSVSLVFFSALPIAVPGSRLQDKLFNIRACALLYGAQWVSDVGGEVDFQSYC